MRLLLANTRFKNGNCRWSLLTPNINGASTFIVKIAHFSRRDRRKLTFFFSVTLPQYYPNQPSPRIDFRTLVRDLYQIYRTRIWMYCVDKDKNRANRAHSREKFLKQLHQDAVRFHRAQSAVVGGSRPGSRAFGFAASDPVSAGLQYQTGEWDMSEVFAKIRVDDGGHELGDHAKNIKMSLSSAPMTPLPEGEYVMPAVTSSSSA
jgi:hypothetical protein